MLKMCVLCMFCVYKVLLCACNCYVVAVCVTLRGVCVVCDVFVVFVCFV